MEAGRARAGEDGAARCGCEQGRAVAVARRLGEEDAVAATRRIGGARDSASTGGDG
jgi:hypothetical protein